jgi:hypothetical protein
MERLFACLVLGGLAIFTTFLGIMIVLAMTMKIIQFFLNRVSSKKRESQVREH